MAGDSFVHLHVHTEYSMLDGAAKVVPLFAEASRLEMPAVAMTDHGNMFGAYEFFHAAKSSGVTPIIGIEAYVAPESRHHKKPVFWGEPSARDDDISGGGAYTHMTMVARNATGLRNLFQLSSLASLEGYYYKPRMDRELITRHADGIIATTGCPGGEVQTRLRLGQFNEALKAAADYRDIFGADSYFLELMEHDNAIERRVREELAVVAAKLNLPPLVTNDSHYVTAAQKDAHAALLCVQSGKTLDDPKRFKFDGEGYFLRSAEQMYALQPDQLWKQGCVNTLAVAERIESYDEVFGHRDRMPVYDVPAGHTQASWLHHEVITGLHRRCQNGVPPEYVERAEFEVGVITQQGFPAYFLVVADLCNYARSQRIRVGPGRGSAAGSLVAYALGITNVDPMEHELLFERFLNPERISMPDIDIDFDDRRRGDMVRYATETYGADKVAQVITFGTIKAKAALKDAARILHGQAGFAMADRISKAMPPPVLGKDISLSGVVDSAHPRYSEAAEVRGLLETDQAAKQIFDTARGLEGLIRQPGVHACAVIMSSEPILDVIPVWSRPADGAVITGFDYPSCEDIGLLKMDFLGLRNLTVIGDAIESVRTNRGVDIDLDTLSVDDPTTYELLSRGDTLGVFQLDGTAMRELLRRMHPTAFADIAAVNALYRPGPMAMNAHNDFADRKNGRQSIKPIHPELAQPLDEILSVTYGLIVYQEQIMKIAQKVAGFTPGQADVLRKAMGKKKLDVLEKEYERFQAGMRGNGFSDEAIKTLWDTILPFAGYAFNKSHAVGYGLIAYWTAYLKANYPAEYMAALLTSVADDKDRLAVYLAECRKMGIKVLPPDVNSSEHNFTPVGNDIRFGLGGIRNVGSNVVAAIVQTRKEKGEYRSFNDFLQKSDITICNKRTIESLIKAGAFDLLGDTRRGLAEQHELAVDTVVGPKRQEAHGQFDLFGTAGGSDDSPSIGLDLHYSAEEWPRKQLLAYEREMLGLYVSSHPLAGAERLLRKYAEQSIAELLADERTDATVAIAGIVSSIQRRIKKDTGAPWAILTIEDMDASVDVLLFPKSYELYGAELAEDTAVAVKGRVNKRDDGTVSIFGQDLIVLEISDADTEPDGTRPVVVSVPAAKVTNRLADDLRRTLRAHPGSTPVQIKLLRREGALLLALDQDFRVEASTAFMGDLKGLLGASCVSQ